MSVVGLEDTYQLLRGAMTTEQAEQFYRSAWTLGTTLQVREDQWPPTREAFDTYWNSACRHVHVDDVVRDYLFDLISLKMINPLLALPFRRLLKFLTVGFLAPVFRDALGLQWTSGQQWRFEHLFLLVAFVNRFLPGFIRQRRQLPTAGRRAPSSAGPPAIGVAPAGRRFSAPASRRGPPCSV